MVPWWGWVGFSLGVLGLLLADLLVFHRDPRRVTPREAGMASAVWITLGLAFTAVVWVTLGAAEAQNYITGYLIEKSLSVDNIFVFIVLFRFFAVPEAYRYRVLFYGVLGALVFRGLFVGLGAVLLAKFSWVAFGFGAILLYTAVHLAIQRDHEVHPERNPALALLRRVVPLTSGYREGRMIVREDGRLRATPLLVALVAIETTDIVFAVDSIPAVFAVTRNAFVVFSSNAFAVLGLRALYFLLADGVGRVRYLHTGLAAVLALVGVKMIYEELVAMHERGGLPGFPDALVWHAPPWAPLVAVALIMGVTVLASVLWRRRHPDSDAPLREHPPEAPS